MSRCFYKSFSLRNFAHIVQVRRPRPHKPGQGEDRSESRKIEISGSAAVPGIDGIEQIRETHSHKGQHNVNNPAGTRHPAHAPAIMEGTDCPQRPCRRGNESPNHFHAITARKRIGGSNNRTPEEDHRGQEQSQKENARPTGCLSPIIVNYLVCSRQSCPLFLFQLIGR